MFTVSQIDEHLIGMGHSGTLGKVRNKEAMYERAASVFALKVKTLEQIRKAALASTIHDDVFDYALPNDFQSLIDLAPQDNRQAWDKAYRNNAGDFDLHKATADRTISIEGREGAKMIRIDWRSRQGKILNAMNDVDDNGTWTAQGTTTGIEQDTITKITGGGSVRFDVAASGDGIKNTTMTVQDFTDEDEVADVFMWLYFPSVANLTSVTGVWGNDVTTKYWTSVAQTLQADGSAIRAGWNLLKFPWATATETGTVAPASIDSFKLTFATTGAIANIRADNILFSIGRNFDIEYYSKFLFKSASTGSWISKPEDDDTYVLIDNDTLPVFLYELFQEMAHQIEGSDSVFDINFAVSRLKDLYPAYKGMNPNMSKKSINTATRSASRNSRRFSRGW